MTFTAEPRVDAYIDALPDWQQAICREVRVLVHAADPQAEAPPPATDQQPAATSEPAANPQPLDNPPRANPPSSSFAIER